MLPVDAIAQAPRCGWGATLTTVLLVAAVCALLTFLMIENRVQDPILPLAVFKVRMLVGANVTGLN